ncbi:MAG: hypothetical protein GY863_06110 [bacterium]|nr:hypothetical protein [bacterium]
MIINVYADDYHSLNLQEKAVSYYLYLSAISGKDFFYDLQQLKYLNTGSGEGSTDDVAAKGNGGDPEEIDTIDLTCNYLDKASSFTTDYHKQVLSDLIGIIKDSRLEELDRFKESWIDVNSNITFLNRFIPGDKDNNIDGVFYVDKRSDAVMQKIIDNFDILKQKLYLTERIRINDAQELSMNSENILIGNNGKIDLPFDPVRIVSHYGETDEKNRVKIYYLNNIDRSLRKSLGHIIIDEFARPEDRDALKEYAGDFEHVFHMLSEFIRNSLSGIEKPNEGIQSGISSDHLAVLDRALGDILALYLMQDPVLTELGILSDIPDANILYQHYLLRSLFRLKYYNRDPESINASILASNFVLQYLIRQPESIKTEQIEGKTYLVIRDLDKQKVAVTNLMSELVDLKYYNDPARIRDVVDKYAFSVNADLCEEILSRSISMGYPEYIKFAYPYLEPHYNDRDGIVDISIEMPESYLEQQKRFSETPDK